MPFFCLNSTNLSMYPCVFSDVAGSTICAPEMSYPSSAALFLTASSLPTRITFAIPSFKIFSVAARVLLSSVSGSTIVFTFAFALSLSVSINPMIKMAPFI